VKKLLGVCSSFADYLSERVNSTKSLTAATQREFDEFVNEVKKFDVTFSSVLITLLDRIARMGR